MAAERTPVPHSLEHLIGRGAPRAPDRASLEAWGGALGAALTRPVVVTLDGELGAGKTTLARALCAGLGVPNLDAVTSPTFALLQEYDSPRGVVRHADLYRLRSMAELDALGWDELVATASVLLVEWPERAEGALGDRVLSIELRHDPEHADRRLMTVRARGVV